MKSYNFKTVEKNLNCSYLIKKIQKTLTFYINVIGPGKFFVTREPDTNVSISVPEINTLVGVQMTSNKDLPLLYVKCSQYNRDINMEGELLVF